MHMVLAHDYRSYTKYDYQFVLGACAHTLPKHHEVQVLPAPAMFCANINSILRTSAARKNRLSAGGDASRAPHPPAPPRLSIAADKQALVRRKFKAGPVVVVVIVVSGSTPHLFGVAGFPKLKFISQISKSLDVTLHGR